MLAGLERSHRLPGVIGDRRVDVDGLDVGVPEQLVEVGVAPGDAESVADGIQLLLRSLTDGVQVGLGMTLVDGNKLRPKAETDEGNVNLALTHGVQSWPSRRGNAFVALEPRGTAMRAMTPSRGPTVNGNPKLDCLPLAESGLLCG